MDQKYQDYALKKIEEVLSIPSPSGYTAAVADYVINELDKMGYAPLRTVKGGVAVDLGGETTDDALLLCCHIDTLGGIVAEVKDNGRLRISPLGCLSPNNTEGENTLIHTMGGKVYSGTFMLNDPSWHVNLKYDEQQRDFNSMEVVIDEKTASKEATKGLGIGAGDFVSFAPRFVVTETGFIKSRFLDDKLSVGVLLAYAKYLKDEKVSPARKVYVHFTVYEEIGHGASAFCPQGVTEILGVDMGCVGEGLECDEFMVSICAKDTDGPSSYEMVKKLTAVAKAKKLNYAIDVYPRYVSDPDATLKAGFDLRHCVIGAGVYASHGYERAHIEGMVNTYELVKGYINYTK